MTTIAEFIKNGIDSKALSKNVLCAECVGSVENDFIDVFVFSDKSSITLYKKGRKRLTVSDDSAIYYLVVE